MNTCFEVGDVVKLTGDPKYLTAPVGSVGVIRRLYEASGGPAAEIEWDWGGHKYERPALLRDLSYVEQKDIDESDKEIEFLLS